MAFDNVFGSYNVIVIQKMWSEIQIKTGPFLTLLFHTINILFVDY